MEVDLKREQDLARLSVLTPGVTTNLQVFWITRGLANLPSSCQDCLHMSLAKKSCISWMHGKGNQQTVGDMCCACRTGQQNELNLPIL